MGLKDNFRQAAKELLSTPGEAASADQRDDAGLDQSGFETTSYGDAAVTVVPYEEPPRPTYIADGVVIEGSVRAEGSVEMHGEMKGNLSSKGNLHILGKLIGDAEGHDIAIHGGRMRGDLTASGQVKIDSEAIVVGDIHSDTLTVNGKVKGDLLVQGPLTLDSGAVVIGTVHVGQLSIAAGAVFQGEVHTVCPDVDTLFRDAPGKG